MDNREPSLIQIWPLPSGGLCVWVDYSVRGEEPEDQVPYELRRCRSMAGMLEWIRALDGLLAPAMTARASEQNGAIRDE